MKITPAAIPPGDITIKDGNIIIGTTGKGIIINDQHDAPKLVTAYDDNGVNTVKVEDAP